MNAHDIILGDLSNHIFDNLTSLELKTLSKVSNEHKERVGVYVRVYLQPYDYSHYEMSPYCPTSYAYDKNIQIPSLQYATRAMALAVTFKPSKIECILNLHPEIISIVLETRTVTITDPLSKQSFTAQWHFKLSHLLACEGSHGGYHRVFSYFMDKYKATDSHHKELALFYGEPVCWESGELKGSKGPTSPFIAILYDNGQFFREIARSDCDLILKDGFDAPFNKINPCYIALQQMLASKEADHFHCLLHQYAFSSTVRECIDIIISEALNGNYASLKLLMDAPSEHVAKNLSSGMFKAIEANNMDLVKIISRKIKEIQYVRGDNYNSPLFVATQKALQDKEYLPMVKHFLCCGYPTTDLGSSPKDLLEEGLLDSFVSLFERDSISKQIRHYFNVAECFQKFITFCAQNKFSLQFNFSGETAEVKDPGEILLATAMLDKPFFNELVTAFLQHDEEWMLNKALNNFKDRKRYFTCLHNFVKQYQGESYLTGETLERIADSVIAYIKSRMYTSMENDTNALEMAIGFYQMVMNQEDKESDCYKRVMHKLEEIGEGKYCDHSRRYLFS